MPDRAQIGHGKNLALVAMLAGVIAAVMLGGAIVIALNQGNDQVASDTPTPETGDDNEGMEVAIAIRATITGSRLLVEGDITVPDGAIVKYEISGPEDCDECHARGRVPVANQAFRVSVDISGWPDDTYRVWTAFQTVLDDTEQPSHVIEKYGELGERMAGATVEADGYTRVEAETTVSR